MSRRTKRTYLARAAMWIVALVMMIAIWLLPEHRIPLAASGVAVAFLIRRQHPEFGTEVRALLAGRTSEDREKATAIVAQLRVLDERKRRGLNHPLEDAMFRDAELSRVRYLRIYHDGHSIRVFFTVDDGTIWMLGVDANKRQTGTAPEWIDRLRRRLRDVRCADRRGRRRRP